jgi:hypothetical protein
MRAKQVSGRQNQDRNEMQLLRKDLHTFSSSSKSNKAAVEALSASFRIENDLCGSLSDLSDDSEDYRADALSILAEASSLKSPRRLSARIQHQQQNVMPDALSLPQPPVVRNKRRRSRSGARRCSKCKRSKYGGGVVNAAKCPQIDISQ